MKKIKNKGPFNSKRNRNQPKLEEINYLRNFNNQDFIYKSKKIRKKAKLILKRVKVQW